MAAAIASVAVPIAGDLVSIASHQTPWNAARQQAAQTLLQQALAGNRNAAQQLYNWANLVGASYPHGGEPVATQAPVQQLWQQFAQQKPGWAAYITGPGGSNGDSSLDSPTPFFLGISPGIPTALSTPAVSQGNGLSVSGNSGVSQGQGYVLPNNAPNAALYSQGQVLSNGVVVPGSTSPLSGFSTTTLLYLLIGAGVLFVGVKIARGR